jgi:hypothetical protein
VLEICPLLVSLWNYCWAGMLLLEKCWGSAFASISERATIGQEIGSQILVFGLKKS